MYPGIPAVSVTSEGQRLGGPALLGVSCVLNDEPLQICPQVTKSHGVYRMSFDRQLQWFAGHRGCSVGKLTDANEKTDGCGPSSGSLEGQISARRCRFMWL